MDRMTLSRKKETKTKVTYVENGGEIVGTIYVDKKWLASNGYPKDIIITIEPVTAMAEESAKQQAEPY